MYAEHIAIQVSGGLRLGGALCAPQHLGATPDSAQARSTWEHPKTIRNVAQIHPQLMEFLYHPVVILSGHAVHGFWQNQRVA